MSMLGAQDVGHVFYHGRKYEIKRAKATLTKNTSNTVVAAVSGKKILVLALLVGPAATGTPTMTMYSDTTAISAAMFLEKSALIPFSFPTPMFITAAAEALKIAVDNTVDCQAAVVYAEVD